MMEREKIMTKKETIKLIEEIIILKETIAKATIITIERTETQSQ